MKAGLKKGDLIVALDDWRVYDLTQYYYVRSLKSEPLKLLVWNGNRCSEVVADPPNRRFGVSFVDFYEPGKQSP